MWSVEVFEPRSAAGFDPCIQRLAALSKTNPPAFVSMSGMSGGLASRVKKELSLPVQIQVDTSQSQQQVQEMLEKAIASGVDSVLVLSHGSKAREGGFADVLELVKFVKSDESARKLEVAVCGYVRGSKGELAHYSKDVRLVAQQVAAGATSVLTTPVWHVDHYAQFVLDCHSAGVPKSVPILPSLLPLHALESRGAFDRLASSMEWTLPRGLLPDHVRDDAFVQLGRATFAATYSELRARCPGVAPHIITLNAEHSSEALRSIGIVPPSSEDDAGVVTATGAPVPPPPTPAALSVPAGSTVHILHSGKLALEIGQMVQTLLEKNGLHPLLTCTEDFKKWAKDVQLESSDASLGLLHAIFIVDTVEDGQPSEAAGPCTRFIHKRSHAAGMLSRLRYAVLGLGDSNLLLDRQTTTAKDCNQVAQKLDRRLQELGAVPFCQRGEADDRTGNEEIEPWLAALPTAMRL